MEKIDEAYNLFFKVWNTDYVPLIANRKKWNFEADNLVEGDIIYFKLKDSAMSSVWLIGKVEYTTVSRDGLVLEVGVSYRHTSDDGEKKFSIVE